jgi:hypothetical protein
MNNKETREENTWRDKAVIRREENKALGKRIKEITHGRDVWKAKAMSHNKEIKDLRIELNDIKKKLKKIIAQ